MEVEGSRAGELAELVRTEVADIVATANEQGFSTEETLDALALAIAAAAVGLSQDPAPANDPIETPA